MVTSSSLAALVQLFEVATALAISTSAGDVECGTPVLASAMRLAIVSLHPAELDHLSRGGRGGACAGAGAGREPVRWRSLPAGLWRLLRRHLFGCSQAGAP